jgi:hypothetical protein
MDGAHLSSSSAHIPVGAARRHTPGMLVYKGQNVQDKASPTSPSCEAKLVSENEELTTDTWKYSFQRVNELCTGQDTKDKGGGREQ